MCRSASVSSRPNSDLSQKVPCRSSTRSIYHHPSSTIANSSNNTNYQPLSNTMSSLRTTRLVASNSLAHLTAYRRCPHAASRSYATAPKPSSKATAAKLNTARKKAAARKTNDDTLENDSLAARTPLKRPSSDGLGVPSASPPPSLSSKQGASRSAAAKGSNGTTGGTLGDVTPAEAERKEAMLREARQARADRTRVEEERQRSERAYEEKKGLLKWRYMRVVVGLPLVVVLSWELWNRCESLLSCSPYSISQLGLFYGFGW